jgi:porin
LDFIGIDTQSTVWELFYNIELTPAVHLTLDAQVTDSALPDTDTAMILGTSMQIRF